MVDDVNKIVIINASGVLEAFVIDLLLEHRIWVVELIWKIVNEVKHDVGIYDWLS